MNPDIEQILLAQASLEAEQGPRLSDAIADGAVGGAALGAVGGAGVRAVNQLPGRIIDGMAARQGMTPAPKKLKLGTRVKPGARMAGGLLGVLFGGGLGAAAQQAAIRETGEAGELLAKMQAQGRMTLDDQVRLKSVLADAYSRDGLLG